MLDFLKRWFKPPDFPGKYTAQDERILERDNQRYAEHLEAAEQAQRDPRTRWHIWFFFF